VDNGNGPLDRHRYWRSAILIEISFVPVNEVCGEIAPHVARHSREAEGNEANVNIDWEAYISSGLTGLCWAVTARDSGKLIGYAIYTIANNPRFKHIIEATSDGIFLEKEYRGKVALQKKAAEILKGVGVHEINYILRENSKFGKVLERDGYCPNYKIWSLKI